MTTTLEHRATPTGDARQVAGGTLAFFGLALGMIGLLQLPAVLAKSGVIAGPFERYMLPGLLGGFSPVVAAIIAARLEAGRAGVRALFARFRIGQVGAAWYVVAIAIFATI